MKISENALNDASEKCSQSETEIESSTLRICMCCESNILNATRLVEQSKTKREAVERDLATLNVLRDGAMNAAEDSLKQHKKCQEIGTGLINESQNHEQMAQSAASEAIVYRGLGKTNEADDAQRRSEQEGQIACKFKADGEKQLEEMALHAVQARKNLDEVRDINEKIAKCNGLLQVAKQEEDDAITQLAVVTTEAKNAAESAKDIGASGVDAVQRLKSGIRSAMKILKDYK